MYSHDFRKYFHYLSILKHSKRQFTQEQVWYINHYIFNCSMKTFWQHPGEFYQRTISTYTCRRPNVWPVVVCGVCANPSACRSIDIYVLRIIWESPNKLSSLLVKTFLTPKRQQSLCFFMFYLLYFRRFMFFLLLIYLILIMNCIYY